MGSVQCRNSIYYIQGYCYIATTLYCKVYNYLHGLAQAGIVTFVGQKQYQFYHSYAINTQKIHRR